MSQVVITVMMSVCFALVKVSIIVIKSFVHDVTNNYIFIIFVLTLLKHDQQELLFFLVIMYNHPLITME